MILKSLLDYLSLRSIFIRYLSSSIISAAIAIFSGFFTYRYIEPKFLGIWALFSVIEVYATFTRMGIINGLGRELPYLLGKGETDIANNLAATALFYSLFSNLFLFLITPLLIINSISNWTNEFYILSFIVIIFRLIFSSYTSYLTVTFRTSENFNSLSKIQNILSILRLLSIPLISLIGFWGLLLREFLISLIEMILFHIRRPLNIKPVFSLKAFLILLKVGFPLFIVSYLTGFIDTLPRLFLIKYGTIEQLGLFSPITIMIGMGFLLPNAISSYMYPKMSYEFGKGQNILTVWKTIKITAIVSIGSGILLFLGTLFFVDYFVLLFPNYLNIIPYLKISSISLVFIGYKSVGLTFAVLKSWWLMFLNVFVYFIISLISVFIIKCFTEDILEIASYTIVATYSFMFVFSISLSYYITHKNV